MFLSGTQHRKCKERQGWACEGDQECGGAHDCQAGGPAEKQAAHSCWYVVFNNLSIFTFFWLSFFFKETKWKEEGEKVFFLLLF